MDIFLESLVSKQIGNLFIGIHGLGKGDLIPEGILYKCPCKHVKIFERGDFVHFVEDWTKHEIHSKIKPPLLVVIQTKVLWRKSFLFGLPTNLQVAFDSSHQLTDCKNLKVVEFSYLQPSLFKR